MQWIASGSFADVHLAREKAFDRLVALQIHRTRAGMGGKLLTRPPGNVLEEAILMARVNDPNVVRVYGARRQGDQAGGCRFGNREGDRSRPGTPLPYRERDAA